MTIYYDLINLSEGQKEKIKKAIESDTNAVIKLTHQDLNGEHKIALTDSQKNRMKAAYLKNTGITLSLSRAQLKYNVKVNGGFLPLLGIIGSLIASRVVPAIATGLLTGTAAAAGSTIVNKIAGNGIVYMKKNGYGVKVREVGKGVFLNPWNGSYNYSNDGYYLRNGNDYSLVGKGFYNKNPPFKNWQTYEKTF